MRWFKNSPDWNDSRVSKNGEASARTIELAFVVLVPFSQMIATSVNFARNWEKFGVAPVDLKKGAR